MSWSDLIKHPYITSDPRFESRDDQMHLSYSNVHGQYIRNEMLNQINESSVWGHDPHTFLNERNAIMLNCKDSAVFNQVYEKTIEHHFKNVVVNPQPVLEINPKEKLSDLA